MNNAHAHIDPMGFDLTARGKPLVVDPGRFTYREDEDRQLFKSAAWHNTLTIDGKSPFTYLSSWRYGPQKEGRITAVAEEDGMLVAAAMHRNYEPAIHHRMLGIIDQRFVLVLDEVIEIQPNASIQLYYHIDSINVNCEPSGHQVFSQDNNVKVALFSTENLVCSLLPGRVSDHIDSSRPSTRACFEDRSGSDTARYYATLIVPFDDSTNSPKVSGLTFKKQASDKLCSFTLDGQPYTFLWSNDRLQRT